MPSLFQTLQEQKQHILDIASQYHAINVRVFGSVIRGEEREDSDINLLVDFLPGTTLLDQVGLSLALSDALKRKVDIVSKRSLNKHLCQGILQEAVPVVKDRFIFIATALESIELIQSYTAGYDLPGFLEDRKTQDAVIRNLEIIGQALKDFGVEVAASSMSANTCSQSA